MNHISPRRGFTLIELLVVIAIIGILSSVVLVSLNSARSKGKDGRVQQETAQIKTWLEANNNGTRYNDITAGSANAVVLAGTTTSSTGIGALYSSINTLETAWPVIYVNSTVTGSSSIGTYSIYSKQSNGYFCLSSSGNSVTNTTGAVIPASPANAGVCQ